MFSSTDQQHLISSSSICPENSAIKSILTTNGSTDNLSSTTNDDDNGSIRWLDFDLIDRISIQTQTLEEIMNEKNEFLLDEESEELFGGLSPFPPPYGAETTCSSVAGVNMPKILPMGRYGSVPAELPKSYKLDSPLVLKREDSISQQINTKTQPKYGHLTSLCIGKYLLSIGTSQGFCLIFEKEGSQKLLHSVQSGDSSFGSISCMDFSVDQTRLAVGFSTGALFIFDTNTKRNANKFIFKSNDVVQPGRGLIHLKYITSNVLLIVDNGGNVYEFHEKRRLNRRKDGNVRCIFTGCKGEVLNISFVHSSDNSVELLVLATFHQVFLLSVKRRSSAVGQLKLHGSSLSPPLIDWRERVQALSHARAFSLRLCIARDNEARLYQVRQRVGGDLLFPILQILKFYTPLINLKWIDDWSLLAICTTENNIEQLQLVEIPQFSSGERKNLQNQKSAIPTFSVNPFVVLDISESVKLVYNSVDFKGLATGCNVSKAMLAVADSICYHTFIRHPEDNHLYLLGADALFRVQLIELNEQLDSLIERSDFCSALMFVVDICCGKLADRNTTTIATANFRANAFRRIPELVSQLLEQTMDGIDSGHIDELIVYYKQNFHVLIRACVSTSHFNLLYETIYSRVQKDTLCRSTFLEMLEEFVLENVLFQPPPSLVNDYLNYLLCEGQIPQFEQSVIRLPVESIDLHQVMTACKEHQLFDATCYIFNNAIKDYITPLNEQFELLSGFVHKQVLSDHEIVQGNKLLLYLSCCLVGRAYPHGDLPDENLALTVPLETYKFIVQLRSSFSTSSRSSSPQNISTKFNELQSFPHLNILLKFDALQFFNVISTCADAPVFAKCEGRLKRLVDMLISKCVEEEDEENDDIDLINELGPLLITFINGLLQKGAIPKDAYLFTKLIERVFLRRAFPSLRVQKVAEQSAVELLRLVPEIDLDKILEIAQPVPYIHVCAYIFTIRREYFKLLECFLADPLEPLNVFPTMVDLLNSLREAEQQESLRQFVRQKLERLCLLDSLKTAEFVLSNFPELLIECRSTPKKLPLSFLNNCFRIRREQNFKTLTGGEEELDELLFDYYFEQTIKQQKTELDLLDSKLVDELRYWLPLGSFSDFCLNISMKQPKGLLVECSALLLLSRGHISRAFEHLFNEGILNKCSQSCVNFLLELTATYPSEAQDGDWLNKLFSHLLNTLHIKSVKDKQEEDPFSNLLGSDSPLQRVFNAIIEFDDGRMNNNLKQQIPIISLIEELFSHKSCQNLKFSSSFKNLLRQMLLVMEVRLVMKKSTKDCVAKELINKWAKLALKRGIFTKTIILPSLTTNQATFPTSSNNQNNNIQSQMDPLLLRCYCCDQRIIKSFYLFSCGHVMHLECINELERKCLCERGRNIDNDGEDINKNYYENGESSDSSSNSTPPLERLRRRKVKEAAALASSIPTITNEER
uniref:Vacuolar protein sorting-associated protein 8 central domain-containing protein n=1 Tax=Meloidogyne incognita TaxID=6306 RepID=A0A914MS46_MELIC